MNGTVCLRGCLVGTQIDGNKREREREIERERKREREVNGDG